MDLRLAAAVFLILANVPAGYALAATGPVTHTIAQGWQSTDFSDPTNPGCSIGGPSSITGSRLLLGASRLQPTPIGLALTKASWSIPPGTPVGVHASFSDGITLDLLGKGSARRVGFNLAGDLLRTWLHEFTSASAMELSFRGDEPVWRFDLAGTSAVVNAMAVCFKAHQIVGMGAPFEAVGASLATQPFDRPVASLQTDPAGSVPQMPPMAVPQTKLPTTPAPAQIIPHAADISQMKTANDIPELWKRFDQDPDGFARRILLERPVFQDDGLYEGFKAQRRSWKADMDCFGPSWNIERLHVHLTTMTTRPPAVRKVPLSSYQASL